MIILSGWRSPGRTVHEKLHFQMHGIIDYLSSSEKIGTDRWNPDLQSKIGATIEVGEPSTLRHIIGFMKSIGVIYDDALPSGKIPKIDYCVTKTGDLLYTLTKMEKIAKDSEDKEVIERIENMYRFFYANVFIYWYVRDSKVHVARTVLKAINKYGYLDKVEWFILNTFISNTDNEQEENEVEKYITAYRSGEMKLSSENIKSKVNSYNYWTQLLAYAGLIKKDGSTIYLGKNSPEFIESILADDFMQNLNTKNRYHLEM
jgi:hypothetical protein